jgi:hypothetical protein
MLFSHGFMECCACTQAFCPLASDVHAELLSRYQHGFASLADVPDDGYFLQVCTEMNVLKSHPSSCSYVHLVCEHSHQA